MNSFNNKLKYIAVFDSGLGGLKILSEIKKVFPNESTIYYSDSFRVPYGSKNYKYVLECSLNSIKKILLNYNVKILIIACNTISIVSYKILKKIVPVKIVSIIEPIFLFLINLFKKENIKTITILGTTITIKSNFYSNLIKKISNNKIFINQIECPLLASLIEYEITDNIISNYLIKNYLYSKNLDSDLYIIVCTHYSFFIPIISKNVNPKLGIFDVSKIFALYLSKIKFEKNLNEKHINRYIFPKKYISCFKKLHEFHLGNFNSFIEYVI